MSHLPPNLPWGLNLNQVKPNSLETISSEKIEKFQTGLQKKSRFQKAREEKELKEKQEAEAAAAIYGDFVKSFGVDEEPIQFVPSGSSQVNNSTTSNISRSTRKDQSEMTKLFEEMKVSPDELFAHR